MDRATNAIPTHEARTSDANKRLVRYCSLLTALILSLCGGCRSKSIPRDTPSPLRVAAASDLAFAFKEIQSRIEATQGEKIVIAFGSTGLLAKQIIEGAPFDVFAAANVSFVDDLIARGDGVGESKALYARGRIVLWTARNAHVPVPESVASLARPEYVRIAIANPEHAPYGKAAQQALQNAGVWTIVQPRLVYGENIQQALQFAQTGNADVAIAALSLAMGSGGTYETIDESLHQPIDQAFVICKSAKDYARAARFISFVASPEGRHIMRRHGFLLPGERLANGNP